MAAQKKPSFRQPRNIKSPRQSRPGQPRVTRPQAQERRVRISDEAVNESILEHCRRAGPEGAVRPEEIAQHLYPKNWRSLLKRVRLFSRQLAKSGQIVMLRKGEVVDPDAAKGIVQLRIAPQAENEAENDSES